MFNVEIQATNGKWFTAYKGENLAPNEADKLITELRAQGFKARATLIDERNRHDNF